MDTNAISTSLSRRFMERVIPEPMSGCWLWTGSLSDTGYGQIWSGRTNHLAHRVSWRLHRGAIPAGMHLRHGCDNRCCVNPEHLSLGTHQDNMDDRGRRGRSAGPKGESHPLAVLTNETVLAIYADFRDRDIVAAQYGITPNSVTRIWGGGRWQHILPPPAVIAADKKRRPKPTQQGTKHGMAKLSDELVRAVFADPRPQSKIAAAFGIAQPTVSAIKSGKTWRHLTLGIGR